MEIKIYKICLLLLVTIFSLTANAQKIIKRSNQQWLQYYAQLKLSNKWTLLADGGYRVANNFQDKSQYIARVGLNYNLNPSMQVGGGFAHLGFYTSGKISKVEFRPYEELSIKSKLSNIDINNRIRIEERFFNPVVDGHIKGNGSFNFRFRYSLIAGIPLFNLSKKDMDKKVLLNIGDEVFFNAGRSIVYNEFDQNRILISPTIQFNKNFAVSLTYNGQFAGTTTPATYNDMNIVWLQIKQKFNIARKKK